MDSSLTLSNMIKLLRVPLTILVIFVHCGPNLFIPYDEAAEIFSFSWWFTSWGKIMAFISSCAVPSFFLISGYLFFRNIESFDYYQIKDKYRSRIRSLILPYLFWNTLVLFWAFIIYVVKHKSIIDIGYFISKYDLYGVFVSSRDSGTPIYMIMWYVRDLIALTILAPLFYFAIRYLKVFFVLVALAFYVYHGGYLKWLGTLSIVFFSIGAWVGLKKKNVVSFFSNKHRMVMLLFVTICLLVLYPFDIFSPEFVRLLRIISVVCIFYVAFLCVINNVKISQNVASASFFIYCIHILQPANQCTILTLSIFVMSNTFGFIPIVGYFLSYMLSPVLTFYICLVMFFILKRCCPCFLNFISGTR